ncbi:MAG: heterodisulfide reductase-related iron-sulfur binding cluster [Arenicellales bacterium]|nr:heterodisulfide reductase-related iron-sulfur binding cluster [Arenicellales bacterium]
MSTQSSGTREGSLEAPKRHPLDWRDPSFYNEDNLFKELERVYDICHGCRRCFSLCNAFPTLFDAIDESETLELDGVPKQVYWDVVDHCYLCDMCFMTKCPYVPPHEWNVDFPHLMLRAKAVKFKNAKTKLRDKLLTRTDTLGSLAGIPVVSTVVNASMKNKFARGVVESTLGVHKNAPVPEYHYNTAKRVKTESKSQPLATGPTKGKVALYATCYGKYNKPDLVTDLIAVFEHNGIPVTVVQKDKCCGMPKLELGDLESVARSKGVNIPKLAALIEDGWDIVAPIPSCVLMYKQELPLMFPKDPEVDKVRNSMFDPFEYLMHRHKAGKLNTEFKNKLGTISYHVPCHLRVQNIGLKTKEVLSLVPDTKVDAIERCSGHDGTYAVKKEFFDVATKICRPVVNRVNKAEVDFYSSDCPMAGEMIANGMADGSAPKHPMTLLRYAYGI